MSISITPIEEKAIIALALDEPAFFSSIIDNVQADYFSLDEAKYVFKIIKFCYDNSGAMPSRELVRSLVEKTLTVDRENFREILDVCDFKINPRDYCLIKDRFIAWLRSKTLDEVYHERIIQAAREGNYSELEKIIERAAKIQDLSGEYMWFFNDIEKIFQKNIEVKYTTGFPELDKYINEGGPTKGDVMVWMAPTGCGKCCTLDTKIIVDKLSTIYELTTEDGKRHRLAGFRKVMTKRGWLRVCELTISDDILDLPVVDDDPDIGIYKYVTFDDIKYDWHGRYIYGVNGFTQIKSFFFVKRGKTIKLNLSNGMNLVCDPEHIVLTNNGEKKVKDLNNNDKLISYDNQLIDFTKEDGPEEDLYDISIDEPHLYYTSGIVSHNSIVICNNAAACVKRGLNVLHITCELSWYKTACRYCGILSRININNRFAYKDMIMDIMKKIKKTHGGDLAIYEFPPDMISVRTIASLVDQLKKTRNWTPHVIAIDYLELLLSDNQYFNKDDEYKRQKKVATEVRQLAKTTQTYVITATQTNRLSKQDNKEQEDVIDINRVSESFGKMMPVDYVVSINQSRSEYNEFGTVNHEEVDDSSGEAKNRIAPAKMRLYIAKNRNGPKFKTVNTVVNFNTMFMKEIIMEDENGKDV